MKGRKPTPTAAKKLAGNPGKRRLPENEPDLPLEAPEPPTWFDAESRQEWDRLIPLLLDARTVAEAYRGPLAAYCEAWGRYVNAVAKVLETGGDVVKAPSGYPIQNPWSSIRNQAQKQLLAIAAEFGMTASSKTRVRSAKAPDAKSALKVFASKRA